MCLEKNLASFNIVLPRQGEAPVECFKGVFTFDAGISELQAQCASLESDASQVCCLGKASLGRGLV